MQGFAHDDEPRHAGLFAKWFRASFIGGASFVSTEAVALESKSRRSGGPVARRQAQKRR